MRAASLALLLLAAPLLAGCLGFGGDDAGDATVQKQQADVSSNTGGIQGVVTDTAVQPIEGANVTLIEADKTTQTASDGSYAFSNLQPGTYTVSVKAAGFISTQNETQVSAGQATNVDFLLTHLESDEAYTQTIEFNAFFECGVGVGWNVSQAPEPPGPVDPRTFGVTWATCATLNLQGNTTNDDFLETVDLEAPIHTLVWEATWDTSGNQLADHLWFTADIDGFANLTGGNATVAEDTSADSPWLTRVNKTHFDGMSTFFQNRCESGSDDGDRYCGYNFRDNGWPVVVRTFTATDCAPAPASACAPVQVEVNHVWSAFYNAPAPEDYSVYQDDASTG